MTKKKKDIEEKTTSKTQKKKQTKETKKVAKFNKGDIIMVKFKDLPGTILGGEYKYNDIPVRVVYISDDMSKLEVI